MGELHNYRNEESSAVTTRISLSNYLPVKYHLKNYEKVILLNKFPENQTSIL